MIKLFIIILICLSMFTGYKLGYSTCWNEFEKNINNYWEKQIMEGKK